MRSLWKRRFVLPAILTVVTCFRPNAAENASSSEEQKRAALLKEVQVPEGFEATIFATPPAVN